MNRSVIGRVAAVIRVNVLGLAAFVFAAAAWAIRPTATEWWGLGVLSVVLALAAIQMTVRATGMLLRIWEQERAIADFEKHGREQKSSQMASPDRLIQAGMIDE